MVPESTNRPPDGATVVSVRRRWPAVLAIGLLMAATVWVWLWFHIADGLKASIIDWAEERRAEGWAIEWRLLSVSGFPIGWDANLIAPRVKQIGDPPPWFWRGPERVTLRYRPWSPYVFDLSAPGRHSFGPDDEAPETTLTLLARGVDGRLTVNPDGHVDHLALVVDAATVSMGDAPPTRLRALRAGVGAVPVEPSAPPHRVPTARLTIDLAGITLPPDSRPVLGHTISRATLTATLLGQVPPGEPETALAQWRDSGGTVEVARIGVVWGPLSIDGEGTLALDAELQPEAALVTRIAGYGETVDALVRAGMIRRRSALAAKLALGALARTPEDGGPPEIRAPLTLQQRQLYIGPVALLVLPRIEWKTKQR